MSTTGGPARDILVTGSHRSGTTWVGRTLASAPDTSWVAEPFHPHHRRGVFGGEFPHWYQYLTDENAAPWLDDLDALFAGRYRWRRALGDIHRPIDAALAARDAARTTRRRLTGRRAVVKDPIALFSAPWLAARFDLAVVLLVRHPAAFTHSVRRLDWRFDFASWLDQPLLVRDLLGPFEDELRRAQALGRDGRDTVDEAALVWKVAYSVAARWEDEHTDWAVHRHEDLSDDPGPQFESLYGALGLEFTDAVRQHVAASTSADNPVGAPEGTARALQRDSRANRRAWAGTLTPDELERLRIGVGRVADRWYDDGDW